MENLYNTTKITIDDYLHFIEREYLREPIFKLELLQKSDETPFMTIEDTMIDSSGSLNVTLDNGTRRTCSFSLINSDNRYTDFFEHMSIGSKFRLSLGYMIKETPFYINQGIFVFDDPVIVSQPTSKIVNINGTDKWSMLNGDNGGILEYTYTIPHESLLGDVVEQTLALDIVYDPIKPNIDESIASFEIPYDIVKDAGSNLADILIEIALTANAYIYYDIDGRLTMKPIEYSETQGTAYHYSEDGINYIESNKTHQYRELYNAVFVVGNNVQSTELPIRGEALNTNLEDPNSVPNLGYKKYYAITDYTEGIFTQELADQRCSYELQKVTSRQSTISLSSRPLYHIKENQIVLITDTNINAKQERFVVHGINMPISTDGVMTLDLVKATNYI